MWFACIVLLLPCGVKLDFIIHSHLTFFQLGCQNQITTINLWSSHAPPSFKHFLFYSICGKIERTKRITYYSPILTTTRCLLSQTRKNIRRIREPKRYNIIIALLPYKGGEVHLVQWEWDSYSGTISKSGAINWDTWYQNSEPSGTQKHFSHTASPNPSLVVWIWWNQYCFHIK